ncbi:MAG: replicative DNA helicase [Armatimonadetes bacterium]|nr:replicative DNA helicase [Armatimonadota bacterium]
MENPPSPTAAVTAQPSRTAAVISERLPPHSDDAEAAALGSMLLSREAADRLITTLTSNDFYNTLHQEIFRAMLAVTKSMRNVDTLTVKEELAARGTLAKVGDMVYLIQLAESVPSPANAEHYAEVVIDLAILRGLQSAGHEIVNLIHDPATDVEQKVDRAEQTLFNVVRRRLGKDFEPLETLTHEFFRDVDRVVETGEPMFGLESGFADIDEVLTGFYPGNLIVVASRPGIGKTSLALAMALNAAKKDKGAVALFSLEMSSLEIVRRLVSLEGRVDLHVLKRLRAGRLSDDDYQKLIDACDKLYKLKVLVDDTSDLSTFEMRAKCRRQKVAEDGLSLVIVDYLQLMRASRSAESRTQQISEIARGLKNLAKELSVPVMALSQLSRGIEQRDPPIPLLSDLRESGSIEADADVVLMLYRGGAADVDEDESGAPEQPDHTRAIPIDMFIRKNRNGPIGLITLAFQPAYTLFSNADHELKHGLGDRIRKKGQFR